MSLSWVEISRDNLRHNLAQFKKIAPQAEIWPVIKSNAYGHGLEEVTEILDKDPHATGFLVANLSEAQVIEKITSKPIMVLSFFDRADNFLRTMDASRISLPIYDLSTAAYLNKISQELNKTFLVNIKIDTGTSRLGFRAEESDDAIKNIQSLPGLQIHSVFTHLAESEAEDQSFTQEQLRVLLNIKKNWPDFKYHAACSAAALSDPNNHLDIVRLGISLYGLWPSPAAAVRGQKLGLDLRPVLSWKSKIIQIKSIKKGETVGYNRTFRLPQDSRIAVLPVGYYDGYDRGLSNKGRVLIKGHLCPLRGNICMNLIMAELPADCSAQLGDAAILLGREGDLMISAEDVADQAVTINYEIVSRINPVLKREVI